MFSPVDMGWYLALIVGSTIFTDDVGVVMGEEERVTSENSRRE